MPEPRPKRPPRKLKAVEHDVVSLNAVVAQLRDELPPSIFALKILVDVVEADHDDHVHRALMVRAGCEGDPLLARVVADKADVLQKLLSEFSTELGELLGLGESVLSTEAYETPDSSPQPLSGPPSVTPTRHREGGRA